MKRRGSRSRPHAAAPRLRLKQRQRRRNSRLLDRQQPRLLAGLVVVVAALVAVRPVVRAPNEQMAAAS
jgi:hypothetical protein|eukprot:COSAG06_NODE_4418_length_4285_cov_5.112040_3_plen_68_part_00